MAECPVSGDLVLVSNDLVRFVGRLRRCGRPSPLAELIERVDELAELTCSLPREVQHHGFEHLASFPGGSAALPDTASAVVVVYPESAVRVVDESLPHPQRYCCGSWPQVSAGPFQAADLGKGSW